MRSGRRIVDFYGCFQIILGKSSREKRLAAAVEYQYMDVISEQLWPGGEERETENKHWLSDSLVGGVLGYVIGRMVVLNHRRRCHILPEAGVDHGSLSFAVTVSSR
jgi:hypothetical protein